MNLYGNTIITRPYPTTLVPRRWHRKRRTAKKWLRRYGFKAIRGNYDPFEVIQIGTAFHFYPEGIEKFKTEMERRNAEAAMDIHLSATQKETLFSFSDYTQKLTRESVMQQMDQLQSLFPQMPQKPVGIFVPMPLHVVPMPETVAESIGFHVPIEFVLPIIAKAKKPIIHMVIETAKEQSS